MYIWTGKPWKSEKLRACESAKFFIMEKTDEVEELQKLYFYAAENVAVFLCLNPDRFRRTEYRRKYFQREAV